MSTKIIYNNQEIVNTDDSAQITLQTADKRMISDVVIEASGGGAEMVDVPIYWAWDNSADEPTYLTTLQAEVGTCINYSLELSNVVNVRATDDVWAGDKYPYAMLKGGDIIKFIIPSWANLKLEGPEDEHSYSRLLLVRSEL